jgi:hypothetical protein
MWSDIFRDVKEITPRLPRHRTPPRSGGGKQAMTASEISAFEDMFSMIFDAASEQADGRGGSVTSARDTATNEISDLFGKLRRYGRKLHEDDPGAIDIDRKEEEIELCDTDQQLLDWALREVFGESQRYEKVAREAMQQAAKAPKGSKEMMSMPPLQPRWYGRVLARLMATFRDRFNDPHLALSMFEHARRLSVPSYVFGCTTPAYNELIETRWRCFRDVHGVVRALEEMRANVIMPDERTRSIVEAMRRDAQGLTSWNDSVGIGSEDVLVLLDRAERLAAPPLAQKAKPDARPVRGNEKWGARRWRSDQDWKRRAQREDEQSDYVFGYREGDLPLREDSRPDTTRSSNME